VFVATLDSDTHKFTIFDPELRRALYWSSNLGNRCEPSAFAIAPDARRIVVGCKAGKLALLTQSIDHLPAPVTLFGISSEGGSPDEQATSEDVTAVGYFGSFFVCGSSKGRLAIWTENGDKLRDPWPINKIPDKRTPVTSVAVSPDGRVLVSGTDDGLVDAWLISQGNMPPEPIWEKRDPRQSGVNSIAFAPDGRGVLAGFADGTVHQYSEGEGKTSSDVLITLNQKNQSTKETRPRVVRVAVSPDGKRILTSGSTGVVQFWNRAGEPLTEPLDVSGGEPVDVAFTSDGLSVITSRADLAGPILPGSPQEWLANACDGLRYSVALSD
jgi:WD40 repeat protein